MNKIIIALGVRTSEIRKSFNNQPEVLSMNRFIFSLAALVLLFSCSEDSSSSNNNNGGGITDGQLAQLYIGSINVEYSGGYTNTAGSDTLTGTAITQPDMNHYITMYDAGLGIAFVGLTNKNNGGLTFVDSGATVPGTILGTINNDEILLISDSGTFTLTALNTGSFKGSFQGEFEGFQNNTPVTVTVSATFNLSGAMVGKGLNVADASIVAREKSREHLDQIRDR